MEFYAGTERNIIKIEQYSGFIEKSHVRVDKKIFPEMCKSGCRNYNKKYSCPPFSPDFYKLTENAEGLFIILFLCRLAQINSTEYNKLRIANAVMKSKIDRLMRILEEKFSTIYLGTGSCRLCKPCKLPMPCRHQEKRRYSLESVGVDCNKLSKDLFKIPLLWYKDKEAPEYTCVLCGLICNKRDEEKINAFISSH